MSANQTKLHLRIPKKYTTVASTVQKLVNLSFDTGLNPCLSNVSTVLTYYSSLYQYWRLKSFKVSVRSGATFTQPDGAACLGWKPNTDSIVNYGALEGANVVPVDLIPGSNQTSNVLSVPASRITQASQWKNTDADIDEDSYGWIYLASDGAFTISQDLLLFLELEIEFKMLKDYTSSMKSIKSKVAEDIKKQILDNSSNLPGTHC